MLTWSDILSCGIAIAFIEGLMTIIREFLKFRRERKAKKEDAENINVDERLKKVEDSVGALMDGMRYILYDRIKYLGHSYISDGEIDFDDRRILNDMHKVYHKKLDGNGDLNILMKGINNLPLKRK